MKLEQDLALEKELWIGDVVQDPHTVETSIRVAVVDREVDQEVTVDRPQDQTNILKRRKSMNTRSGKVASGKDHLHLQKVNQRVLLQTLQWSS